MLRTRHGTFRQWCRWESDRGARANPALRPAWAEGLDWPPSSATVHGISYGVAAVCELTHGRSMAAILPAVMRYNLSASLAAFRRVAELLGRSTKGLGEDEAAALSVDAVEGLLDRIGVAHRLRDYGLQRDQLGAVADLSRGRSTISSRPTLVRSGGAMSRTSWPPPSDGAVCREIGGTRISGARGPVLS